MGLEGGIQDSMDSGEAGDSEYWAAVLRRLGVAKAKARLREVHAGVCWRGGAGAGVGMARVGVLLSDVGRWR